VNALGEHGSAQAAGNDALDRYPDSPPTEADLPQDAVGARRASPRARQARRAVEIGAAIPRGEFRPGDP
jgi:hypothetical protein